MNSSKCIALFLILLANIVCAIRLFKDDGLNKTDEGGDVAISRRFLMIYSAIAIVINIGIGIFMFMFYKDNSFLYTTKRLLMLALLWPIALIDIKTYRIPNKFIIIGLLFRLAVLVFELFFEKELLFGTIKSEIVAVIALCLAALLCSICMKGSIGYGDIKLFIVMGLLLGMDGIWGAIFMSLIIAFFSSLFLLLSKKKGKKDVVPFAPSIAIGTYISIILTGM